MADPIFDAASSTFGTNVSSLTWSHVCTGTSGDGILTVPAGFGHDPASAAISSATFNGVACSPITGFDLEDTNFNGLKGFYLLTPPVGTFSVVVTYSGLLDQVGAGACSYTGVNQATPFGTAVMASGLGAAASTGAITLASGEIAIGAIASDSNGGTAPLPLSIAGGGASRWERENVGSDTSYAQGEWSGGPGSVTPSWTQNNDHWVIGAIPLKGAGAAGTTITPAAGAAVLAGTSLSMGFTINMPDQP